MLGYDLDELSIGRASICLFPLCEIPSIDRSVEDTIAICGAGGLLPVRSRLFEDNEKVWVCVVSMVTQHSECIECL